MGSLPNLHELSKVTEEESLSKANNTLALNECPFKGRDQDWKVTPRREQSSRSRQVPLNNQKILYARSTRRSRSTSADRRIDNVITLELLMLSNSPVSSRSTRSSSTTAVHYHSVQTNNTRHRDSMASSSGTSSVKHLIALVRSTPSELGPVYSRRVICKNFAALSLAHAMLTAAFVPLFALQSSVSSWWWPSDGSANPESFNLNAVVGSLLLDITCTIAAVSSLFTPAILRILGPNWTLIVCYCFACLFVGVHLYPTAVFLIPGYLLMGVWLGPLVGARITALMTLASKLTYVLSQDEEEEVDDAEGLGRREVMVHRLSRGLQVAQDFGLIMGNLMTALLLWYIPHNAQEIRDSHLALESMYLIEEGERVCGSSICPVDGYVDYNAASTNTTTTPLILSCKTSTMLASVYLGFCFMSLGLTVAFMDQIRMHAYQHSPPRLNFSVTIKAIQETFKDPKLQLAAPLAVFIGLEQGFMYSDFTKSYAVCSLDIPSVALIFISMGVMQSIAAFTINMVLQHMRRYYVIYVGFVFHSLMLLVLTLWKPAGDDPALFYVIPAAWGVCNAVWETLSFSLIVTLYPDSWQGAIGHNYFFRYLGLSLSFGLHGFVCNTVKIYILAGALVLATVPYTWLEIRLDQLRRQRAQLGPMSVQNY